jgi:hypothetical protein
MLQNAVNKTKHNADGDEKQTTVNKTKEAANKHIIQS